LYTVTREKFAIGFSENGIQDLLGGRVGVLPALQAPISHEEASVIPKEGWAIRTAKKSYRFSDKQKSYLMAKFHIGQRQAARLTLR